MPTQPNPTQPYFSVCVLSLSLCLRGLCFRTVLPIEHFMSSGRLIHSTLFFFLVCFFSIFQYYRCLCLAFGPPLGNNYNIHNNKSNNRNKACETDGHKVINLYSSTHSLTHSSTHTHPLCQRHGSTRFLKKKSPSFHSVFLSSINHTSRIIF